MYQRYAADPRMRLNLGIRRRLAPLLDNDQRKIALLNSMLFTFPGSPILYYGDEIGMGDNIWLPDRNGVRTPMQWENDFNAGFSEAPVQAVYTYIIDDEIYGPTKVNVVNERKNPDSLFNTIRHMIAVRKQHRVFGWGDFDWLEVHTKAVAAYTRSYHDEKLYILNNLSDNNQRIVLNENPREYTDLLTGESFSAGGIELGPYKHLWLKPNV